MADKPGKNSDAYGAASVALGRLIRLSSVAPGLPPAVLQAQDRLNEQRSLVADAETFLLRSDLEAVALDELDAAGESVVGVKGW